MAFTERGPAIILGIMIVLGLGGLVDAQGHVQSEEGSDAVLPCVFDMAIPENELVTWERTYPNASTEQVLYFDKTSTPKISNVHWLGDLSKSDASIKISPVSYMDAGDYTCEILFSDNRPKKVTLSITAKATMLMPGLSTIVTGVALMVIVVGIMCMLIKWRRKSCYEMQQNAASPVADMSI